MLLGWATAESIWRGSGDGDTVEGLDTPGGIGGFPCGCDLRADSGVEVLSAVNTPEELIPNLGDRVMGWLVRGVGGSWTLMTREEVAMELLQRPVTFRYRPVIVETH